jgi:phosphoadenosine phosphosulfate reductase
MTATLHSKVSVNTFQSRVESLSQHFEPLEPRDLLLWAIEQFGHRLVVASSLGAENLVLLDMMSQLQPDFHAFFLDTDFHFPETLELKDRLQARYPRMQFQVIKPDLTPQQQAEHYGPELYKSNPDLCCRIRKVEPLNRVLSHYDAWMTGMRRDQSPTRAHLKKVEWDARRGCLKLIPLANWTDRQVWTYIMKNKIPYNPLHDYNYPSIGCLHCTAPVAPGQDPRSGRWQGQAKTECGLHT